MNEIHVLQVQSHFISSRCIYGNQWIWHPCHQAVIPQALFLKNYETWIPIGEFYTVNSETAVWPENVSNPRIRWTTSNPDVIAIVQGKLLASAVGNAVITGTLHNGVSASCTVHVYDPHETPCELADGVRAFPEELRLVPGQTSQVLGILTPEGRPLEKGMRITVTSDNPSVAEVSSCGSLGTVYSVTGREIGTATLKVEAEDVSTGTIFTSLCTVTVGEPSELSLPASLTGIEDAAFLGTAPNKIIIPAQVTSIGSKAFANNNALYTVIVYSRMLTIEPDAFIRCPNLMIYGYAGTVIDTYCSDRGIPFVPLE